MPEKISKQSKKNELEIGRHLCDTYSVDMLLSPGDFSLRYSKGGAMKLAIAVVVAPSKFNINVKSGNDSAINKAVMRIRVLTTHHFQLKSEKVHFKF